MEAYGEKDIESYNNWQADHQEMALPRIVIFIDELEALMREDPRRTEENLCLLTQIGRASGIHVIAATQNLTSSVITDRIKSEMPDRIVFRTASTQESRSLLGDTGAEELENSGDMLITVTGMPIRRAHEADVRPDEIEAVAKYLRRGEK
jgi:S-DNA-T family DNA segregation ATPase FtsK/SpoIIIE